MQEISSWFKESCAEIKKYQYYSDNRNNPIFWLLRPVLVQKPEFKDCNKFLEIKKRDSLILKDMLNSFSQELTSLYDLFLEYPPDWENRRSQVIARDRICQQCSKQVKRRNKMHIHHVVPRSKGGTNRLDNLVLLCEKCHKKIHKNIPFEGDSFEPVALAANILLINTAIALGNHIKFKYKKPTDLHYIARVVKPREFVSFEHHNGIDSTLCITGYCYLRREERTFALKRMRDVTFYYF
ncbi:MAG: hypothetical protein GX625_21165 [Clostridiaceae bacterium]|nr:hypothetical protein [Clostridiaceae bacterium]